MRAPAPTWVNREYILGPIYHYEHIDDGQAMALGLPELPRIAAGSTVKRPGYEARRLRDGLINARVEVKSGILKDDTIKSMVRSLKAAADAAIRKASDGSPEPLPDVSNRPGRAGTWELNIATQTMTWSCRTRRPNGSIEADSGCAPLDAMFLRVPPEQHQGIRQQILRSIITGRRLDMSYELRTQNWRQLMRMIGDHAKDAAGQPVLVGVAFEIATLSPRMVDVIMSNPPFQAQAT